MAIGIGLLLGAGLVGVWWGLTALWVYSAVNFLAHPHLAAVEFDGPDVPEVVRDEMVIIQRTLYSAGFDMVGVVEARFGSWGDRRKRQFVAVLENQRSGVRALLTARAVRGRWNHSWRGDGRSVEFWTELADGSAVVTDNSWTIQRVAPDSACRLMRLPGYGDVRRLHEIHRSLVRAHGEAPVRVLAEEGASGEAAYIVATAATRHVYAQLSDGYLYFDPPTDALYPTWRGAWRVAVEQAGPLAWFWRWRSQHAAEALLRRDEKMPPILVAQPA